MRSTRTIKILVERIGIISLGLILFAAFSIARIFTAHADVPAAPGTPEPAPGDLGSC